MWQFINGQLVWVKDAGNFRRKNRFAEFKIHGEGEGGSGNGDGGKEPTAVEKELAELKESNKKLLEKNKELLDEGKKIKESTKVWEGLDPTKVRNLMKQLETDEELKLITEGKHDEVIKRRTEKLAAEHNARMKTIEKERDEYKTNYEKSSKRVSELLINTSITQNFIKAKGEEHAIKDVVARARKVWSLEDGEPVPRGEDGEILQGKKGIMTQEEWIESLKIEAPHLFPGGTGTGSNGSRKPGSTTDIDSKISAARKAGDFDEVRRLKKVKATKGKE